MDRVTSTHGSPCQLMMSPSIKFPLFLVPASLFCAQTLIHRPTLFFPSLHKVWLGSMGFGFECCFGVILSSDIPYDVSVMNLPFACLQLRAPTIHDADILQIALIVVKSCPFVHIHSSRCVCSSGIIPSVVV
jgi:hypothetical protein